MTLIIDGYTPYVVFEEEETIFSTPGHHEIVQNHESIDWAKSS